MPPRYPRAMSRRSTPERIHAARHSATRNRLIGERVTPETADAWIAAWAERADRDGIERGERYWGRLVGRGSRSSAGAGCGPVRAVVTVSYPRTAPTVMAWAVCPNSCRHAHVGLHPPPRSNEPQGLQTDAGTRSLAAWVGLRFFPYAWKPDRGHRSLQVPTWSVAASWPMITVRMADPGWPTR